MARGHFSRTCDFIKRDGSRCMGAALPAPDTRCLFHSENRAVRKSLAKGRRKGGAISQARTARVLPADTPPLQLASAADVRAFLTETCDALRRGLLQPKIASTLAYVAQIILGAMQQEDVGPTEVSFVIHSPEEGLALRRAHISQDEDELPPGEPADNGNGYLGE